MTRRASRGPRGSSNGNARGNAEQRRMRREWMIAHFGVELPDRTVIPCHHCAVHLAPGAFEIDRYPICGKHGGSYRKGNIVPVCEACNKRGPERCCERARRR